jgi:hypothetical protein
MAILLAVSGRKLTHNNLINVEVVQGSGLDKTTVAS